MQHPTMGPGERRHPSTNHHARGGTLPHPALGPWERRIHAESHHRTMGEVAPHHIPP